MRVKATFTGRHHGFYGGLRRYDGDEFELSSPSHFSKKWMVAVDKPKRDRPSAKKQQGAE